MINHRICFSSCNICTDSSYVDSVRRRLWRFVVLYIFVDNCLINAELRENVKVLNFLKVEAEPGQQ